MGAELLHVDGQTDVYDEVSVAFRNFVNAPKSKIAKISFQFLLVW
jgi:hypothetical protein